MAIVAAIIYAKIMKSFQFEFIKSFTTVPGYNKNQGANPG
jgi:hypothetical protein